ncbi:hypothetical protein Aspvir_004408 [Aspergillus viridinutans]|uniref:Uncharacterized protein n=1 Tax=Aspergillus viridinutans TaxID=75553 RepID=A0A9P3F3A9_ASPVI|nr:uncharacterized protein Aspvir_004408 [Aspergillus viridinutans]GIK00385.1 hypothetical protein Aspvir_004408 [Aspergillus viridinutans]
MNLDRLEIRGHPDEQFYRGVPTHRAHTMYLVVMTQHNRSWAIERGFTSDFSTVTRWWDTGVEANAIRQSLLNYGPAADMSSGMNMNLDYLLFLWQPTRVNAIGGV